MNVLERLGWKIVAAVKWLLSIWSGGGPGSSSRVHLLLAFLSAIALTWRATITGTDIPPNAYMLACALLGTGGVAYVGSKVTAARKTKDADQ